MNSLPRTILAVFLFEYRRTMKPVRLLWWAALTAFPILLITVSRFRGQNIPDGFWITFLFVLIPMLLTMLGTFLWASPAIGVELERKSWVYLAVRPYGRTSVLLGKYLAAIAWVLPSTIFALTACVLIVPFRENAWQTWWALARITALAVPAYAAIYLVIGTLFTKRAMVAAVSYTLIFELLVSFVPALVNRMTIQYRLRGLLLHWSSLDVPSNGGRGFNALQLLGDSPAWYLVITTIAYTICLLIAAVVIVRNSEFSAASESDV